MLVPLKSCTELSNYTNARSLLGLHYVNAYEGPQDARIYNATVLVNGRAMGIGYGSKEKHAKQVAAADALAHYVRFA